MAGELPPAEDFVRALLVRLGTRFAEIARGKTNSETLSRSMLVYLDPGNSNRIIIESPQYWAVYYHDGRGPVAPLAGTRVLVWYLDPKQDPRNPSGTVRALDIRRLTEDEFKRDRDAGRLVITPLAGPARGTPYFDQAAEEFLLEVDDIANSAYDDYILTGLPHERVVTTVKLR